MINVREQIVDKDGRLTQAGYAMFRALERRLEAVAAVADPAGGVTVDAEARAAIAAIKAAAG